MLFLAMYTFIIVTVRLCGQRNSSPKYRAAKLRLLNFLSLFRDLQKPTRFSGGRGSSRIFPPSPRADAIQRGGGVVAELFRHLQEPTRFSGGGGGSSIIFP